MERFSIKELDFYSQSRDEKKVSNHRYLNTLYTQIGDILGWICVVGLVGLIPLSIILRIKLKKVTT
jgi:hypothetical protein